MSPFKEIYSSYRTSDHFCLNSLTEKDEYLCISLLSPTKGKLEVSFDSPLAYRRVDESDALLKMKELGFKLKDNAIFYKAEQSDFKLWLYEQSEKTRKQEGLFHYVVVTSNEIIDVIAYDDPILLNL